MTPAVQQAGLRGAWTLARSSKRVWLAHLAGNVLLLLAAYAWLWIPDARAWQLASSAFAALLLAAAVVIVHGGTLGYFHWAGRAGKATRSLVISLSALLFPVALWLAAFCLALWYAASFEENTYEWATNAASWLTMQRQKPVDPDALYEWFEWGVPLARWFVISVLLLPLGAVLTLRGWSGLRGAGLRAAWRILRSLRYWLGFTLLFLPGVVLPWWLAAWAPDLGGVWAEAASAAARLLAGYIFFTGAWLTLLALLARLVEPLESPS